MDPAHVLIAVVSIAVMYFGSSSVKTYLEHRKDVRAKEVSDETQRKTLEALQFTSAQETERMNRTIKDATVKRFHYDSHDQLRAHLTDFMAAYNFARRLKTLGGLTPYEYICKIWTSEPDRFILDPIHQMPGLNTWRKEVEQDCR